MRKATETQKLSSCPTKKKKKSHHEAGDVHLLAGLLDGGGPLAQAGGLEDLPAPGGHLLALFGGRKESRVEWEKQF